MKKPTESSLEYSLQFSRRFPPPKRPLTPAATWLRLPISISVFTGILVLFTAYAGQPPRYVEGELLVKFAEGTRGAAAEHGRQTMQHEVRRNFDFIGWQQIRLPRGMSVEEGLARYRNMPGVLAVEPNYISEGPDPIVDATPLASGEATGVIPNDPRFPEQYALARIQATNAWEVSTGDSNIVVAIIDSGINYEHEDLVAHMWRNPGEIPGNNMDDDSNGYVDDVYGIDPADDFYGNDTDPRDHALLGFYHGTGCAGVIGASANNGLGIAGLNWNVQLMALRILRTNNTLVLADALEAYAYVGTMKDRGVNIKVINMSYGLATNFVQSHYDALVQIAARGILMAVIAHNQATNNDTIPRYPSSFDIPAIVAVAATDQNDNLATFSNWGRTNVDLAAPGVAILMPGGPGTGVYWTGSGTSQAGPHVAGAAALLFALNPDASVEEVKSTLMTTVDLIPALTNKVVSHGRLNVARAVSSFASPRLVIERNAAGVRVIWPRPATGFVLEETAAVNNSPSETVWSEVPLPYRTNATHVFMERALAEGNAFYRLRKP